MCFLLGNSPVSQFYMPTFWNTICSIFIGRLVWRDFVPTHYEDGTNSVPKRRHMKFRLRGSSQKKAYNRNREVVPSTLQETALPKKRRRYPHDRQLLVLISSVGFLFILHATGYMFDAQHCLYQLYYRVSSFSVIVAKILNNSQGHT